MRLDAIGIMRIASRLQRVIGIAERATFAVVSVVGAGWIAGRILLEDWTSQAEPGPRVRAFHRRPNE